MFEGLYIPAGALDPLAEFQKLDAQRQESANAFAEARAFIESQGLPQPNLLIRTAPREFTATTLEAQGGFHADPPPRGWSPISPHSFPQPYTFTTAPAAPQQDWTLPLLALGGLVVLLLAVKRR